MSESSTPWEKYKKNLGESRPWDMLNPKIEFVDESVSSARYSLCKECPELIKLTHQCKKCGCFMSAKTKLPNATCPLGKW
jgi:hypothetical protein